MKKSGLVVQILAICVLAVAAVSLGAQATPDGVPVTTVITIEPQKGVDMPTVSREDMIVFEGKDRDKVTDWVPAQGDRAALEYFILIDDSLSTDVALQFEDMKKFIAAQPASAKVGIAYMQDGSARIVQELTTDRTLAGKALRLPMGGGAGNSSPYFAVSDLIKRWPATTARREVLMIANGIDAYYDSPDLQDPYLQQAIGDAQRAGVIVSAIYSPGAGHSGHSYWQTYWGQMYLSELADRTGGESYYIGFTGRPVTFAPYLDDQAKRLGRQYFLTFLAKPQKKAGLQKVKVKTEAHGVDVIAPDQVYVPAGQ